MVLLIVSLIALKKMGIVVTVALIASVIYELKKRHISFSF